MGKTVILIHGFLESEKMWEPLTSTSSSRLQFLSLPLAGHVNGNPILPQDIDGYAEDIHHLMETKKVKDAFLVGHSMGGYCALAFAKKYPLRVRGMCLFHSTASEDTPTKKEDRKRAMALVRENKSAYIHTLLTSVFGQQNRGRMKKKIDELVKTASEMSVEAIIAAQNAMMNRPSSIDYLIGRRFPLFYFLGDLDEVIPPERVQEELEKIPGLLVHRSPKSGHMGQYEDSREAFGFIRRIARAH